MVGHTLLDVDVGLDGDVGVRGGHADERLALVALGLHEGEGAGGIVVHVALDDLHLARGAGAVGAGVGQPHPGPQAGVEDGLVGPALDRPPERLDVDGVRVTHDLPPFNRKRQVA